MSVILDLLFPAFCIGCKKFGTNICEGCYEKLEFIDFERNIHLKNTDTINGRYSLIRYKTIGKLLVKQIKYKLSYAVLDDFFRRLPKRILEQLHDFKQQTGIQYIQPIPLHPQRQNIRGFNQSELIARKVSKVLNIPVIHILERVRNTSPQALIKNKGERDQNVSNAFSAKMIEAYHGSSIVLVDDLFTTGSTCKEGAKALKNDGVKSVFSFTLAQG